MSQDYAALMEFTGGKPVQDYYTPKELASLLGLSVVTVNKWRQRGKGPAFYRLGRKICYSATDVDRFVRDVHHVRSATTA